MKSLSHTKRVEFEKNRVCRPTRQCQCTQSIDIVSLFLHEQIDNSLSPESLNIVQLQHRTGVFQLYSNEIH